MFYQSRWLDPYLGRMAQADSIIPPGVQGLDRYAYANNSPMNFVDPSGHFTCSSDQNSDDYCPNLSSLGSGDANLEDIHETDEKPGCDYWGENSFSCQTVIDKDAELDDFFSGMRMITRVGWLSTGLSIGAVAGLIIASKVPHPIAAGVTGLVVTALVTFGVNTVIAPYDLELINDLETEFKAAQDSGKPLVIGTTDDPSLELPFGGNYVVDGQGDGKGTYVNFPGANLTVHIYDLLFGLNLP